MKIKQKIGLIGVGNMGSAIFEGLLKKKMVTGSQLWVYDKIGGKAQSFAKQWKVQLASSNADLVEHTDAVLLAVKPQDLKETADQIKNSWRKSQTLISILAGTPVAKIKLHMGPNPQIVRAMPNLGAKVGQSMTALTGDKAAALLLAEQIFSGCGKTVRLDEKFFDLVTAVSGSGPAYFFLLMELMAKKGIEKGLEASEATLLAVQTAVGAALLAQSSPDSPEELREKVTSKGGTTAAALKILEEGNFAEIFHQALEAALQRGKELSRGNS